MTEDNKKFNTIPRFKLRIKVLTLLTLLLSSCSNPAIVPESTSNTTKNTNKQLTTVNEKITVPVQTEDLDEKIIKEIIKNSPDFFPGDLHDDIGESQATVPNNGGVVFATVPNNGGVVFVADPEESSFGTKAMKDKINQQVLQKIKDRIKNKIVDKIIPSILKKTIGEPKKDTKITFSNNKTRADVVIKVTYQKEILNRLNLKFLKKVNEESVIKSVFIKDASGWKLSDISPIDTQSVEEKGKVKLESVKVIITPKDDKESIRTIDVNLQETKNKNSLITISRGDILTFEVKASENNLGVFVKLSNNKLRIPLYDDGSNNNISGSENNPQISGDDTQNDNIYTGNITVKSKVGVNYLTLDIIRTGSDDSNPDNFASVSKSIPFIIN